MDIYPMVRDLSLEGIQASIRNARYENFNELRQLKQKMLDYYRNDQTSEKYLGQYGFFDNEKRQYIRDLPWTSYNYTSKVINQISMVYKRAPVRRLKKEDDQYNQFIIDNPQFNGQLRVGERLTKLLSNVLFRPVYDEELDKWFFFVEHDYIPYFKDGNPLFPIAYDIPVNMDNFNHKSPIDQKYLFISDDYYFYHTDGGDPEVVPGLDSIDNPYGIIPLVDMSDFVSDQYWGYGKKDIVEANQMFNIIMLTGCYGFHHQSFGIVYAQANQPDLVKKMQIGPWTVTTVPEDSTMGLLTPNLNFAGMAEWAKSVLSLSFQTVGVMAQWNDSGDIASGVSLKIKNKEVLEQREEDIEKYRIKEQALFDVMRVMLNYHGKYKIPDNEELTVDFAEPDFPIDPREERESWAWLFQQNLASKIDYLKEHNPDLDDDSAEKEYQRIIEQNRKLRGLGTPGAVEDAFTEGIEE